MQILGRRDRYHANSGSAGQLSCKSVETIALPWMTHSIIESTKNLVSRFAAGNCSAFLRHLERSLSLASCDDKKASENPQPCYSAANFFAKRWEILSSCVTLLCHDLDPVANFACRKSIC